MTGIILIKFIIRKEVVTDIRQSSSTNILTISTSKTNIFINYSATLSCNTAKASIYNLATVPP